MRIVIAAFFAVILQADANVILHPPPGVSAVDVPGLSQALFNAHWYTCVTNHYINNNAGAGGNDSNDGLTSTFSSGVHGPWLTINAHTSSVAAGDCLNVVASPTAFTEDVFVVNTTSGTYTPTGQFVFRCTTLGGCTISHDAADGNFGITYGNYNVFEGFVLQGNNAGAHATGPNVSSQHHITFINMEITNWQGHGLNNAFDGSQTGADYLFYIHNYVHDMMQTGFWSGVNAFRPKPYTGATTSYDPSTYHIQYLFNLVNRAYEVDGTGTGTCGVTPGVNCTTDGNCFILDNQDNGPTAYTAKILFLGNIGTGCGAKGINLVGDVNVVAAHNTMYHNNWDQYNNGSERGEILIQQASPSRAENNTVIDNIGYSVGNSDANGCTGGGNVPDPDIRNCNSPYTSDPLGGQNSWTGGNIAFATANAVGNNFVGGDTYPTPANLNQTDPRLAAVAYPGVGDYRLCTSAGVPVAGCAGASPGIMLTQIAVPNWPPASPQWPTTTIPNASGACDTRATQCPVP